MYDDFMRDAGVNVTQFSLLRLIRTEKEISVSTLGRYMVMDRTSITRALAPLGRDSLINSRPGADKRMRIEELIVGATPGGYRRIGVVPGGSFEGERLSGEVLDGGSDCPATKSFLTAPKHARYGPKTLPLLYQRWASDGPRNRRAWQGWAFT